MAIPGQMDIYDCIAVAATGADGKTPTERNRMTALLVSERVAYAVANRFADDIVEAVEAELGIELSETQAELITDQVEGDLQETIQEAFAAC